MTLPQYALALPPLTVDKPLIIKTHNNFYFDEIYQKIENAVLTFKTKYR
jgi:hypothetical protein